MRAATTSGRSGLRRATGLAARSSTRRRCIRTSSAAIYALAGRDLLIVRVVPGRPGSASCVLLGLAGWRLFSHARGHHRRVRHGALRAGDLLRRPDSEVGARRFFMCLALLIISGLVGRPCGSARPACKVGPAGMVAGACARPRDGRAQPHARERAGARRGALLDRVLGGRRPDATPPATDRRASVGRPPPALRCSASRSCCCRSPRATTPSAAAST